MEKYSFHAISDPEYIGIITILDYEIRLSVYLSEIEFSPSLGGKKAIVDLALKSGMDRYRFIEFDVDDKGKIVLDSNCYVQVSKEMEEKANSYLKQKGDIVLNSFLTDRQKQAILC